MKSDVYDGRVIPAGAIVIPNVWYVSSPLMHRVN